MNAKYKLLAIVAVCAVAVAVARTPAKGGKNRPKSPVAAQVTPRYSTDTMMCGGTMPTPWALYNSFMKYDDEAFKLLISEMQKAGYVQSEDGTLMWTLPDVAVFEFMAGSAENALEITFADEDCLRDFYTQGRNLRMGDRKLTVNREGMTVVLTYDF